MNSGYLFLDCIENVSYREIIILRNFDILGEKWGWYYSWILCVDWKRGFRLFKWEEKFFFDVFVIFMFYKVCII